MSKPIVSVVIPFRNARRTILQCVQSVSAQSLDNIEIVLCDDRSTDGTKQYVLSNHVDGRIKWFHAEGAGAFRAEGAETPERMQVFGTTDAEKSKNAQND